MKRFLALESREIVAVVSVAMFIVQLDAAVLAIALPDIAAHFHRPALSASLAITFYLTMLIALLPVSGWLAERFGPRRTFLWATLGFGLFSLACALAPDFWIFILFRGFQGACASLMTPVARLIMLKRTRKAEMVDALAITAIPMLLAPTVGPSIGGLIVEYGRWEYIFLLNVPLALALIALTLWRIPETPPDGHSRLDWRGAALLGVALITVSLGFDRLAGDAVSWLPWTLIATGVVLGLLAWQHLRTYPCPIVSLTPLQIPAFRTTAIGAGAMIRIPGRAILFALPLMWQLGFGYSPFAAGLLLLALNGGDLLTKPLVKPLFDRLGYDKAVLIANLGGLAALGAIGVAEADAVWLPVIILALFVSGVSRSVVFTGMASLTFTSLGPRDMTSGNVVASISMQLFNALAVSLTALVLGMAAQLRGHREPDLADFRITLILLVIIGLAATWAIRKQLPRDLREIHAVEEAV